MAAPSKVSVRMQLVVSGDHMSSPWVPTVAKVVGEKEFMTVSSRDKQLKKAADCSSIPAKFMSDLLEQRNLATAAHVEKALKQLDPQHSVTEMEHNAPENDGPPHKKIKSRDRKAVLDDIEVILPIKLLNKQMHVLAAIRLDSSVQVQLDQDSMKNLLACLQHYDKLEAAPAPTPRDRPAPSLVDFEDIGCPKVVPPISYFCVSQCGRLFLEVHWFRKQSLEVLYRDEFGRRKSKSRTPEQSSDITQFRNNIIKTAKELQDHYESNHVAPDK